MRCIVIKIASAWRKNGEGGGIWRNARPYNATPIIASLIDRYGRIEISDTEVRATGIVDRMHDHAGLTDLIVQEGIGFLREPHGRTPLGPGDRVIIPPAAFHLVVSEAGRIITLTGRYLGAPGDMQRIVRWL